LESTPPEINIKIESWNDACRRDAEREYRFAILLLNGHNEPKSFPRFDRYYPEKVSEPPRDEQLENAMKIAKELGHI
jgi:hypothetical protein